MFFNGCKRIFAVQYKTSFPLQITNRAFVVIENPAPGNSNIEIYLTKSKDVPASGSVTNGSCEISPKLSILSEEALCTYISTRELYWQQKNIVRSVASSLLMSTQRIKHLISTYPALTVLAEEHFIQAAQDLIDPKTERFVRGRWQEVETRLRLISFYGVEVHRLRLAKWIWTQEFATLEERLKINTNPETKAFLCIQRKMFFNKLMFRYSTDGLTKTFEELYTTLHQYIGLSDSYELLHYLQRSPYLFVLPIRRIQDILSMLLDAGITKDEIRADLWILHHNLDVMKERIDQAHKINVSISKPWVLRCDDDRFGRYMQRRISDDEALQPHGSKIEFLAAKLSCTEADVKIMQTRFPLLLNINLKKLSSSIDYLLEQGYLSYQVGIRNEVMA